MRIRLAVRIGLFVAMLVGVAAIWISFSSRRAGNHAAPAGELLDPGVTRKSTDFEHSEFKLGKLVFRVVSSVDTLTDSGVHELNEVGLTVHDDSGTQTDWVSGDSATYAIDEKKIEFTGKVDLRLADGTRIRCDRLQADLDAETVFIPDHFRYERGEISGSGRKALYRIQQKTLEIDSDFQMLKPSPEKDLRATSSKAVYEVGAARLNLIGKALMQGPDFRLNGDQMLVKLTPERRVSSIHDSGQAVFVTGAKSFTGDRINLHFNPAAGRLSHFEVLAADGADRRAVYQESGAQGNHRLEARSISGTPSSQTVDPSHFQLERFLAEGEVVFSSAALGVDRGTAARLEGTFDGQGRLRQATLKGQVTVERKVAGRHDQLSADRVRLDFDQNERLEQASAFSNAEVTTTLGAVTRRHWARDSIVADFNEGKIARLNSSGDCRVETREPDGDSVVRAPAVLALFSDGLMDSVLARDGAVVEFKRGDSVQRSRSRQLRLSYNRGKLTRAVQSGDFHFEETAVSREIEMWSEEAFYNPLRNSVLLEGRGKRPVLKQTAGGGEQAPDSSTTVADRFEIDRASGRIVAKGGVQTRVEDSQRPLLITSETMIAEQSAGWVDYLEGPRVSEGNSYILGKKIRLVQQDQTLLGEGDVESFLSNSEGDKLKSYRVSADRVRLLRAENKAVYEGNVKADGEELTLNSPFLELSFVREGMDELREAIAWGGVRVEDATRVAVGEKAFYEPGEKKVRVLGDKAHVTDAKQGKATGSELIFYLGDERIFIEGLGKKQP